MEGPTSRTRTQGAIERGRENILKVDRIMYLAICLVRAGSHNSYISFLIERYR